MPRQIDPGALITVYSLASSHDLQIRYIGQTTNLKERLKAHAREMRLYPHRHLSKWKNKVLSGGHEIVCDILKEQAIWSVDEVKLIAEYRAKGCDLVNGTNGGDGVIGYKLKPDHIAKLVLSARTRVVSASTRTRLSQARRNFWASLTPAERAAIGEKSALKLRGVQRSDEFKIKVGNGHRGTKHARLAPVTEETRRKLSIAAKGKRPSNLDAIHAKMVGTPKPIDVRQKISATLTGRVQSTETKNKRSTTLKAKFATPEYKSKRSAWVKKAWLTRKGKLNGLEG